MSQTGQSNSWWICRVREFLKQGFGVEDIALKMNCDVEHARTEVQILRDAGELERIYQRGGVS